MTTMAVPAGHEGWFGLFLELTKARISIASTLTAATGYLAVRGRADLGLLGTLAGTLMLAMAASTLNEVQERDLDAQMPRTRLRPIPRGAVSPFTALMLAGLLATMGFGVLLASGGWAAALLGLLALVWYNGLYTPLKRVSAFAVVPGSVIGALPPAIGWAAAGGALGDPAILALAFLFFVWQVPHFWLLALLHHEGYAQGGFPTLLNRFTEAQVRRLIFTWTCGTVAAGALLPMLRTTAGLPSMALLGAAGFWLVLRFTRLLGGEASPSRLRRAFMDINLYALVVMAAVVLDALGLR